MNWADPTVIASMIGAFAVMVAAVLGREGGKRHASRDIDNKIDDRWQRLNDGLSTRVAQLEDQNSLQAAQLAQQKREIERLRTQNLELVDESDRCWRENKRLSDRIRSLEDRLRKNADDNGAP